MRVLLLSDAEVERIISVREVLRAVETAFVAKAKGKTQMPAKLYVFFSKYNGDFRTMPAYLEDLDVAGAKIVNVHPNNPKRNLPSIMATILLLDPKTGAPLSIIGGTWITNVRTGAAGAIAAKYLARKDSHIVAIVGSGVQAKNQLIALNEVMKIQEVRVSNKTIENAKKYANEMSMLLQLNVVAMETTEKAVRGSDIVVTTTPTTEPIVMDEWIAPGTHINAIGADAPGKCELDQAILKRAKIVVDDREQTIHSGEINVPFSKKILNVKDIYAELGEIIVGKKRGRVSEDDVTVFDSTGLAIHDVATAWAVYQKAKKTGKGVEINL